MTRCKRCAGRFDNAPESLPNWLPITGPISEREYTRALIRDFANGSDVALVGSTTLAEFAERELNCTPVPDSLIAEEIAPCFIDADKRRTVPIVLACTHYPLLLARFERLSPWRVSFIDPARAIARRVIESAGRDHSDSWGPS